MSHWQSHGSQWMLSVWPFIHFKIWFIENTVVQKFDPAYGPQFFVIVIERINPLSSFSPSLSTASSIFLSFSIECLRLLPSPVKFQSQATVKGGIVSPWWGMSLLCFSKTSFGQEFGGISRSEGEIFFRGWGWQAAGLHKSGQERRNLTDPQTQKNDAKWPKDLLLYKAFSHKQRNMQKCFKYALLRYDSNVGKKGLKWPAAF